MNPRVSLALAHWPDADRKMWDMLTRGGGPLDDLGALSHLKPVSLEGLCSRYGLWLAWLQEEDPAALLVAPAERATPAGLRGLACCAVRPCTRQPENPGRRRRPGAQRSPTRGELGSAPAPSQVPAPGSRAEHIAPESRARPLHLGPTAGRVRPGRSAGRRRVDTPRKDETTA